MAVYSDSTMKRRGVAPAARLQGHRWEEEEQFHSLTRRLGRVTVPARGLPRFVTARDASAGSRDDQFLREICYGEVLCEHPWRTARQVQIRFNIGSQGLRTRLGRATRTKTKGQTRRTDACRAAAARRESE